MYTVGVIEKENAKILVTASKTDLKWTSNCCGDRETDRQLENYCYLSIETQQAVTDQMVTSLKRKISETIMQYLDKLSCDKYK